MKNKGKYISGVAIATLVTSLLSHGVAFGGQTNGGWGDDGSNVSSAEYLKNYKAYSKVTDQWGGADHGVRAAAEWEASHFSGTGASYARSSAIDACQKAVTMAKQRATTAESANKTKVVSISFGSAVISGSSSPQPVMAYDWGPIRTQNNNALGAAASVFDQGALNVIKSNFNQASTNRAICVAINGEEAGDGEGSPPTPVSPYDKIWTTTESDELDEVVPYLQLSTFTPELNTRSLGGTADPIGKNNLHNQSQVDRTSFADLVDEIHSGARSTSSADETFAAIKALKAEIGGLRAQEAGRHYSLEMDESNKKGMAEGGVMSVNRKIKWERIQSYAFKEYTHVQHCYAEVFNGVPDPSRIVCGPVETTVTKSIFDSPESRLRMNENVEFYQIISAHCNKIGFDRLIGAAGGQADIVKKDNDGGKFFGTLTTKSSKNAESAPFRVVKGQNEWGNLDFYTKECPFTCEAEPGGATPATSGDNGLKDNNVSLTGTNGENGGAYMKGDKDNLNLQNFNLFRDGNSVPLTVNLWVPKSGDAVRYNGEKAITTTISRWDEGTPDVIGNEGGKFVLALGHDEIKRGSENRFVFGDKKVQAPKQMNWNKNTFKSENLRIIEGQQTEFAVASTWASEENKPNALNFKWEFDPETKTVLPAAYLKIGLEPAPGVPVMSSQRVGMSELFAKIQGKCYASFGVAPQNDTTKLFAENTGKTTENNLDGNILGRDGDNSKYNLIINSIRATTE